MRTLNELFATSLAIVVPLITWAQTETEPNDAVGQPNPLQIGVPLSGDMGSCTVPNSTEDWFSFTPPGQGVIQVQADVSTSGPSPVNVTFTFYNGGATTIVSQTATAGANGVAASNTLQVPCRGPENVRLRIQNPAGGFCTSYSITFTMLDPLFSNDVEPSPATGTPLAVDTYTEGQIAFTPGDNNDLFQANLPGQGILHIDWEAEHVGPAAGTAVITLLNSGGLILTSWNVDVGANSAPVTNTVSTPCRGNLSHYRIRVVSNSCGTSYRLRYRFTAPVHINDTEPNNTTTTPVILLIDTYTEGQVNFEYGDNTDHYRMTLPGNGVLHVDWEAEHNGSPDNTAVLTLYNSGGSIINTWTTGVGGNSVPMDTTVSMLCRGSTNYYTLRVASNICGTSYKLRYRLTPPLFPITPSQSNSVSSPVSIDLSAASAGGQINFYQGFANAYYLITHPGGPLSIELQAEHADAGNTTYSASLINSGGSTLQTVTLQVGGASQYITDTADFGVRGAANYRIRVFGGPCGVSFRLYCFDNDDDGVCNSADVCPGVPEPGSACDDGDANTVNDVITGGCACVGTPLLRVSAKVLLEGPYLSATGLMNDVLRTQASFPTSDPYPGLGYTHTGSGNSGALAPAVLAVVGSDAITDWVLLELRSPATPASIIASRSCLLQRDGDVVDRDGVSPVTFNAPVGSYLVAVRHRNHLGAMTVGAVALTSTTTTVDLTSSSTATYGTQARKSISGTFPAEVLWAGDVTFNAALKYTGTGNDRDPILVTVGSTTPNNVVTNTYSTRDVNLNGEVKYTGSGNDRDPILVNVGSTTPNNVRAQQLP